MFNKVIQTIAGLDNPADQAALRPLLLALADRLSSQLLVSGALAINAAASPIVKAGSAIYALAGGVLVTKAANTAMAALAGTVNNATFGGWAFFIDSGGNLSSLQLGSGATLAQVTFPNTPAKQALIGYVIVNPTGTGNFVGGTTALDDITVVPNAVYVNTLGAVDPSVLLGV